MAKLSRERLREYFEVHLLDLWEDWGVDFATGDPFVDKVKFYETDRETESVIAIFEKIGYLLGIHHATGWPLSDPRGAKEWRPGR